VAYTQIVTISTDEHHTLQEFRASVGAQWTFLSDADHTIPRDLEIWEYTTLPHQPTVPHTFVLEPGLKIYKMYIGYWFWGNMLGPNAALPTISTTILTPRGSFIGAGLFGISALNGGTQSTTPLLGIASMLLLLLIPLLVMLLFYRYLRWEQFRK